MSTQINISKPIQLEVNTTPIASGTIGRVLFKGTGNVLQQSSSLFWDNTNQRLQVGASSTSPFGNPLIFMGKDQNAETNFQISNSTSGTAAVVGFRVFGANNRSTFLGEFSEGHTGVTEYASHYVIEPNAAGGKHGLIISIPETTTGSDLMVYTGGRNLANRKLTLFGGTGNLGINTTTDAGFRLDVNGTARVSGTVTLNNTSGTNRSTDVRLTNSSDNFPTATFYPSSGTNVGQNFQIIPRGTGLSANIKSQLVVSGTDLIADGTNFEAMVVRATGTSFTLTTGKGGTGTIRPILLSSGFLDGSTNPNQLWLYSTGNIGINTTTDAGFRLDVNGTARVSGNLTAPLFWAGSNATTIIYSDDAVGSQNGISLIRSNRTGLGNQAVVNFIYQATEVARFTTSGILAINTTTPNASSIVDITSTTRGFLPPRMTTTQKNAIASPATGLQVYDTTLNRPCFYDGTTWITL